MMLAENRKYRIGGYQAGEKPEDTKHHSAERFEEKELPAKVDLRQYMTEVEEQVGNSCVANAFVGAYEYLAKRSIGYSDDVSRLFGYYNARVQHNCQEEDKGTAMYFAIKSLVENGACSEEIWPNDEELLCSEPDESAYEHAANFKITDCEFITTDLNLWRHTLAEGYPIAFALNLFNSFGESTRNKGRVPMPKKSDNVRETHGWHAMLCVGYSDKDRMFIVRNSWCSEWGDNGYCYIPYDYIIHPDYNAHDSWIIKSLSDTDFSTGVWEDDESFFAGEGELFIYDFYVTTDEPDNFIDALDALCLEYVESEEDYYFDYDYDDEEDDDGENYIVNILNFDITIDDSEEFIEKLEALCEEYAIDEDYSFSVDDEEEEDEYDEDDD